MLGSDFKAFVSRVHAARNVFFVCEQKQLCSGKADRLRMQVRARVHVRFGKLQCARLHK